MIKYFIIIAVTFLTAITNSFLFESNIQWYNNSNFSSHIIDLQKYQPVWLFILLLTTLAAILLWEKVLDEPKWKVTRRKATYLFITIAALTMLRAYTLFTLNEIAATFAILLILFVTLGTTMVTIWKLQKIAALLLIPHITWVIIDSINTYNILLFY